MSRTSKRFLIAAVGFVAIAGVLAPMTAEAGNTTTITATVNPTITVASGGAVTLQMSPGVSSSESRASDAVTVVTNDSLGYNLTLADSDATNSLQSGGNSIPATSAPFATPGTFTLTNVNKWGFGIAGGAGFSGSYTAINNDSTVAAALFAAVPPTASPQLIKTTSTTTTGDVTTVWYGARVDATQPSGVAGAAYTDIVTYTATAK